ncbi:MAG: LPS export ABC transporter periplasmic protein LptC [Bacteroidetes bacterium]|nr:LPS export ABC transporter periplasmic protein LptC [Bacteroidota bacterium]
MKSPSEIRKIIRFYVSGIFYVLIGIVAVSCKNDIETINSLSQIDSLPMEFARDIEVYYSDSGKIQAMLKSPYMIRIEDDDSYFEFPDGFEAVFYDSVMQPQSIITANYGISYENKKQMEARNNVVVRNLEKQEQLNTEHLVWDRRKGIIYSNVFVKITKPDEVIYGDGLKSDQNFEFYEIDNPTGEFQVYPDGGDSIQQ